MADSEEDSTLETPGLDQLLKALKAPPPVARIGILGSGDARPEGGGSNATIAAAHEYGAPARGLPARSFLRVPLSDHLDKRLEKVGLTSEETMKAVVKAGSVKPWLEQVLTEAKAVVLEAFATGGFGKWQAWKNPNYENNTGGILVDTTQLRDSITTDVKDTA